MNRLRKVNDRAVFWFYLWALFGFPGPCGAWRVYRDARELEEASA